MIYKTTLVDKQDKPQGDKYHSTENLEEIQLKVTVRESLIEEQKPINNTSVVQEQPNKFYDSKSSFVANLKTQPQTTKGFLQRVQYLDKIQNFESPLDKAQILQTLANPQNIEEFITVKLINRNIKKLDPSQEMQEFELRNDGFHSDYIHKLMVEKTSRHQYFKSIGKIMSTKNRQSKTLPTAIFDSLTLNDYEEETECKSDVFLLVSFWKHSREANICPNEKIDPICIKEFYIENYKTLKVGDNESSKELLFFLGELNELFFFTTDTQGRVFLSKADLEYSTSKFEQLPVKGKPIQIKNQVIAAKIFKDNILQGQPVVSNNRLIMRHDQDSEENGEFLPKNAKLIFYHLDPNKSVDAATFVINDAFLFLQNLSRDYVEGSDAHKKGYVKLHTIIPIHQQTFNQAQADDDDDDNEVQLQNDKGINTQIYNLSLLSNPIFKPITQELILIQNQQVIPEVQNYDQKIQNKQTGEHEHTKDQKELEKDYFYFMCKRKQIWRCPWSYLDVAEEWQAQIPKQTHFPTHESNEELNEFVTNQGSVCGFVHSDAKKYTIISDKRWYTWDKTGGLHKNDDRILFNNKETLSYFFSGDQLTILVTSVSKDGETKFVKLTSDVYKQNQLDMSSTINFYVQVEHTARTTKLSARLIPLISSDTDDICAFVETYHTEGKAINFFAYIWSSQSQISSQENLLTYSVNLFQDEIISEFPLLVSLSYHSMRNKLLIANLTINSEQLRVDLGEYRFIKFVQCAISHSEEDQYNSRVYFLVQHKDELNIMELMYFEMSALSKSENQIIYKLPQQVDQPVYDVPNMKENIPHFKCCTSKLSINKMGCQANIRKIILIMPKIIDNNTISKLKLLIQTCLSIWCYFIESNQIKEPISLIDIKQKMAPICMVQQSNQNVFYVQQDTRGYSIIGIFLNNQERTKFTQHFVQAQSTPILHLEISRKNEELLFMDFQMQLKRIEGELSLVSLKIQDQQFGKMSFDKLQLKFQDLARLLAWNPIVLSTRSLLMIDKTDQQFLREIDIESSLYSIVQEENYIQTEDIEVSKEQSEKNSYNTQYLLQKAKTTINKMFLYKPKVIKNQIILYESLQKINYINKQQLIISFPNGYRSVLVFPDRQSKMLDVVSQKAIVQQNYFCGNKRVVRIGPYLANFSYITLMLERVEEIKQNENNSQIFPYQTDSSGERMVVNKDDQNTWHVYKLNAEAEWHEKSIFHKYYTFQELTQQISVCLREYLNIEFGEDQINIQTQMEDLNTFDENGVPVIAWLIQTDNPKNINRIQKVITTQVVKKKEMPKEKNLQTLQNSFVSETNENQNQYQHQITNEVTQNSIISYIIWTKNKLQDLDRSVGTSRFMITKNFLLWTEPGQFIKYCKRIKIELNSQSSVNSQFAGQNSQKNSFQKRVKNFLTKKQNNLKNKNGTQIIEEIDIFEIDLNKLCSKTFFRQHKWSISKVDAYESMFFSENGDQYDDFIQIIADNVSIIWDLENRYEVNSVRKPNQFKSQTNFIMTGHTIQANFKEPPVVHNRDRTIFIKEASPENDQKSECFRLYCATDLQMMIRLIELYEQNQEPILDIDHHLLIANIRGVNFFALFRVQDKLISVAASQICEFEFSKDDYFNDPAYVRQLYYTLRTPCMINDKPNFNGLGVYQRQILGEEGQMLQENILNSQFNSILQFSLENDTILLNQLLRLVLLSSEIRSTDLIQNVRQFGKILKIKGEFCHKFIEKLIIQTDSTKKVTGIKVPEDTELVAFSENSIHLLPKYQIEAFEKPNINSKGDTQLEAFIVYIVDLHWLTNQQQIPLLLQSIMDSGIDETFDLKIVKIILSKIDYRRFLLVFMFVPYCIYMALLILYFCYCVADINDDAKGFLGGKQWEIAVRIMVLVFTIYWIILEVVQMVCMRMGYFSFKRLQFLFAVLLNLWILIEHSTNFTNVGRLRLVQITSLESFQLWLGLINWLRVFSRLAIWVQMIQQTLKDIGAFMILVIVTIAAFGNAIFVLDHFDKTQYALDKHLASLTNSTISEQDGSFVFNAFGSEVTDTWIQEYLLGVGSFDFSNYNNSPSYSLLWIYLVGATFLTQITFFNMLIANMGSTYDNVREFEERNIVKMTTELFTDYAYILAKLRKVEIFQKRFLYFAELESSQQNIQNVDVVSQIKKILTFQLDKGFSKLNDQGDDNQSELKGLKEDFLNSMKVQDNKIENLRSHFDQQMEELKQILKKQANVNKIQSQVKQTKAQIAQETAQKPSKFQ